MTTPTGSELPRHVHYCKDFGSDKICADRGYCECECGARSPIAPAPIEWMTAAEWDAKEPAK